MSEAASIAGKRTRSDTDPRLQSHPAFCRVGDWFVPGTPRPDPTPNSVMSYKPERFSPGLPVADPETSGHRLFLNFGSPHGPAWRRVE